jgi:hypothetical protein
MLQVSSERYKEGLQAAYQRMITSSICMNKALLFHTLHMVGVYMTQPTTYGNNLRYTSCTIILSVYDII